MHIFRRPDYHSDTTQFLAQLHKKDPNLSQRQQAGRTQTWTDDIPPTPTPSAETQDTDTTTLAHAGYVYLNQPFTQP